MTAIPTPAYLICTDCRLGVLLGETTATADLTITAITTLHTGHPGRADTVLAVWRLLTEHVGHTLRVLAECWYQFDLYAVTRLAGIYPHLPTQRPAHLATDITAAAYTCRWPYGRSAVPDYRGATPTPPRNTPTNGDTTSAELVCVPCRISVDLGDTTVSPTGTTSAFSVSGRGATCFIADAAAALARLLVEHAGHDLYVFLGNDDDFDGYLERGPWLLNVYRSVEDVIHRGDLSWQQYAAGWPATPLHPRHLGVTPVGRLPCTSGGRTHDGCQHTPPLPALNLAEIEAEIEVPRPPEIETSLSHFFRAVTRARR